jgi:hypothetical protein
LVDEDVYGCPVKTFDWSYWTDQNRDSSDQFDPASPTGGQYADLL